MPTKKKRQGDKFTWDLDNPPMPLAACSLCTHLNERTTCTAYPHGIPNDILEGKDYHHKLRDDQVGTDVFKPVDGVNLPGWLREESLDTTSRWQQLRNEKVKRPEHQSPAGQFRAIACDAFETPFMRKTDDLRQPVAACSICTHTRMDNKCSAYPDGIPDDILTGQDQHVEVRADQIGTDVFNLSLWKQFRNEQFEMPEHHPPSAWPAGAFRVIACDTFEGPFADAVVGDFTTLDEAIKAAKNALEPMTAVYVYDDTGQLKFNAYMPSEV
jgi:hypothetical protein